MRTTVIIQSPDIRKMNSFSPIGIFAVLLFACHTPIQGQTFIVLDVSFDDGGKSTASPNKGINLIKVNNQYNTYAIVETIKARRNENEPQRYTRAIFGLHDMYTMLGKIVVLRTNANKSLQMELSRGSEAQLLFHLTTRPKLHDKIYSYKLSAVYKYNQGRMLSNHDLSISGYSDTISPLPVRYAIHAGEALTLTELRPLLFWTAPGFNYRVFDNMSIILTLAKPADGGETFDYYLVKFVNPFELVTWKMDPGKYHTGTVIPEADDAIYEYFVGVYDHNA